MMPQPRFRPTLAMCNFITDLGRLKKMAFKHGFGGIDWSFDVEHLPNGPAQESRWADLMVELEPLEVRYHCPFMKVDIGHENPALTQQAVMLFEKVIKLVSKAGGRYLTLHIGLGHDTTRILSWNETIANLRKLVHYGAERGVTVCLENLAWGWTSKPNLFEKLVRRSGVGVTFDIGHAHACEAVESQLFEAEDFVSPHPGRVYNAHVYFTELPGIGHLAPESLSDIRDRLDILQAIECHWWTLEIKDLEGLLQTRMCIDQYLDEGQTDVKTRTSETR